MDLEISSRRTSSKMHLSMLYDSFHCSVRSIIHCSLVTFLRTYSLCWSLPFCFPLDVDANMAICGESIWQEIHIA